VNRVVWRFASRPGSLLALGWIVLVIVLGVGAPLFAPHNPVTQDLLKPNAPPSSAHWLGTDDLGRDVLSRLFYGARISMQVSFEVVGIALVLGLVIGLIAGYAGGPLDYVLMRVTDVGLAFPPLVLALAVVAVLGSGVNDAALALAVVFAPGLARFIRGQTLAVKEEDFVDASRSIGSSPLHIVVVRVLPNVLTGLVVQISLALAGALLAESTLAFLGLGAPPPAASWGSMLREAYDTSLFTHPWSLVAPGAAIALTVLAFNTVGDGLRDALGGARRPPRRWRVRRARGLTVVASPPLRTEARLSEPAGVESVQAEVRPLLDVEGLTIELESDGAPVRVVDGVSFQVRSGRILGLVGESGSGKTLTALAILRLLASPPAQIVAGSVRFDGLELLEATFEEMRRLRGREMAMVFQDPLASLNPAFTVGFQLGEAVRLHEKVTKAAARARSVELLRRVGISDPERRLALYPHQLSGGMRQRTMIAMALACHPRLLIADEPTTSLDTTVQAQIVDLLIDLQQTEGLAVLFVTHDLALVSELCDETAVMYAGEIVETSATLALLRAPRHPYTASLLAASGGRTPDRSRSRFGGGVALPGNYPTGCRFHPRCAFATSACEESPVALEATSPGRRCRCLRETELSLTGIEIDARVQHGPIGSP
jgi:peptide/nickel transport system permease protein